MRSMPYPLLSLYGFPQDLCMHLNTNILGLFGFFDTPITLLNILSLWESHRCYRAIDFPPSDINSEMKAWLLILYVD